MKNTLIPILFLVVLSNGCTRLYKENVEDSMNSVPERLDSLMNEYYERDQFHGGIVVAQNGEPIYERYVGLADRGWGIPIDEKTKFDIASVNKSMIAALVMKAVEDGRLNIEDKLVDLLAGFPYVGNFHEDITLHNMLCHVSGLPDYDNLADELRQYEFRTFKRMRFTNEAYVNFISLLPPVGKPNESFYYSNFAYHLLTIILEETYNEPFACILEEKLTKPLGLTNTMSTDSNEMIVPQLAKAYQFQQESGEWTQNQFIDLSIGRRIFSTASDLNRWAHVMDNPGWLKKESLDLMKRNQLDQIAGNIGYGYGWAVVAGVRSNNLVDLGIDLPYIIHGGSTEGYKSMLINLNNGGYVISFLSNVGALTDEVAMAQEITKILIR
ncbi:MAG: beta-lactamase family protein [Bacteroidia bacterium]|nr:beta-lactamase family protein [Bacteroidia bacterium]